MNKETLRKLNARLSKDKENVRRRKRRDKLRRERFDTLTSNDNLVFSTYERSVIQRGFRSEQKG